ncbi:MAG: TetR/AcrR family transcriptional regulator [Robiginitomaculum sp.]
MDRTLQILDIAERKMRLAGYNAVSYRDIAAEIGINSASLHYYFPKKEDLGVALVQRYSNNFNARLADLTIDEPNPQKMITIFIGIYRYALEEQCLVCLCAILGAEAPGLPRAITAEVKNFFTENITWLTTQYRALGFTVPIDHAKTTLALLEGAMIISSVNDDITIFNAAATSIKEKLSLAKL